MGDHHGVKRVDGSLWYEEGGGSPWSEEGVECHHDLRRLGVTVI